MGCDPPWGHLYHWSKSVYKRINITTWVDLCKAGLIVWWVRRLQFGWCAPCWYWWGSEKQVVCIICANWTNLSDCCGFLRSGYCRYNLWIKNQEYYRKKPTKLLWYEKLGLVTSQTFRIQKKTTTQIADKPFLSCKIRGLHTAGAAARRSRRRWTAAPAWTSGTQREPPHPLRPPANVRMESPSHCLPHRVQLNIIALVCEGKTGFYIKHTRNFLIFNIFFWN